MEICLILLKYLEIREASMAQEIKNMLAMQQTCLIPELGRFPGEGNDYPLQYSCLGNPWTEEPGGLQSMESQRLKHD